VTEPWIFFRPEIAGGQDHGRGHGLGHVHGQGLGHVHGPVASTSSSTSGKRAGFS